MRILVSIQAFSRLNPGLQRAKAAFLYNNVVLSFMQTRRYRKSCRVVVVGANVSNSTYLLTFSVSIETAVMLSATVSQGNCSLPALALAC
ncbi:hypothetical protein [uncultured Chloroflexus sp.]|uniref:hypothetical protein n=1 Tax=uncultured Chloroflexus sp. TaxID=214040 RepID=UPI00261986B1|nr:hypothetical protein [uncultured Chloroflexus sp.]